MSGSLLVHDCALPDGRTGQDVLVVAGRIAAVGPGLQGPAGIDILDAGGWLLVEHGWQQGEAVRAIFEAAGFAGVATMRDLEDRDRVTLGMKPMTDD